MRVVTFITWIPRYLILSLMLTIHGEFIDRDYVPSKSDLSSSLVTMFTKCLRRFTSVSRAQSMKYRSAMFLWNVR